VIEGEGPDPLDLPPPTALHPGRSRRVAARSEVALIAGYHSPQIDVEVRLNTNEAPDPPPAAFVAALAEATRRIAFNRYPDRAATELRAAIGALHGVGVEQVFCGNGSNEVLQALFLAYGGPGRVAAVFEPTYALHSHIARITGTAVVSGERDEDFLIDERELARVLTAAGRLGDGNEPAISFVCSPNNPTGQSEPRETVEMILEAAPGLVVVDEAYGQFAKWSATEFLFDNPHLVVVRTFSKTWSLAGLRLGYAIADAEVIDAMFRVTLPYHLDALKQEAGRLALGFEAEMRERVARLTEQRGRLVAGLSATGAKVYPSDANFILFRPAGIDAQALWRYLVQQSILVRDVSGWPRLEGCLRVTVGTAEENERFLAAVVGAPATDF
jgi:histidinol-phosphate aminotransferase